MKKALYLVLKNNEHVLETLERLKQDGFNATIISTESLHHVLDEAPEDLHFFSLRHYEQKEMLQSILCLFVVDVERVEEIKQTIRNYTNNFNDIKGFMFTRSIDDYEGSI